MCQITCRKIINNLRVNYFFKTVLDGSQRHLGFYNLPSNVLVCILLSYILSKFDRNYSSAFFFTFYNKNPQICKDGDNYSYFY